MVENIREYNEIRKRWGWSFWTGDINLAPSIKQMFFARKIAFSLKLDIDALESMDKIEMSVFISNNLEAYNIYSLNKSFKEMRQNRIRISEEVLNEGGMDASDFGIYAWGDS